MRIAYRVLRMWFCVKRTTHDARRTTQFLLAAFLLICISPAKAEIIDGIAAVVDGEVITTSEVDAVTAQREFKQGTKRQGTTEALHRETLDKLIDELLLKHAIDKAKITVDDNDLARAIANVIKQNRMTPEELRAELASKGISYELYKHQLADQIKLIKFTNQVVGQQVRLTDRDLRDYYEQNKDQFGRQGSSFEEMKDKIYDALYEEKLQEALNNYILEQRKKVYIDIR